MRRVATAIWSTAAALTAATAFASASHAQGFFQQLFGFSTPPPAVTAKQSHPSLLTPGGRPYHMPGMSFPQRRNSDGDDDRALGGRVKTVCVRMCDGYFFPVSNSTLRRHVFRDQMKCRAACGEDARLFQMPVGSTDVGEAHDGNGRIYGLLNVAHRHKKSISSDCQCRSAPWSEAEMARHAQYASAGADKLRMERAEQVQRADADKTIGEKAAAAEAGDEVETVATPPEKTVKIAAAARPASAAKATTKHSTQTKRTPQSNTVQAAKPATTSPAGAMGLGAGSGYAWPGDAPKR